MAGENPKCLPLSPWDELPAPRRELDGIERIFMTLNAIRQNPGPFAQPLLDLVNLDETGEHPGVSGTGRAHDSMQETLSDMLRADVKEAEIHLGPTETTAIRDDSDSDSIVRAGGDSMNESSRRRRDAQNAHVEYLRPLVQRPTDLAQSTVVLGRKGMQPGLPEIEAYQESLQDAAVAALQTDREAIQALNGTDVGDKSALAGHFHTASTDFHKSARRRRDTPSEEFAENTVQTAPESSRNLSSMLCYPDQVTCANGLGVCLAGVCHCINDYILRDGRCQPELLPLGSFCDPEKASPTCAPGAQCQDHICVCKRGQKCDEDGQARKRETVKASTVGVKHSGEPCRPGDICLNGTSCVNGVCLCPSGYRFEVSNEM